MFWGCSQNLLFIHNVLNDLRFLDVAPIKDLNCINFVCPFIIAGIYLPKISRSKFFNYVKVGNYHFLLVILSRGLLYGLLNVWLGFWRFDFKVDDHFSNISFIWCCYILRNRKLLMRHKLAELDYRIHLVSNALSLKFWGKYYIDDIFKLLIFFEDALIFLQMNILKFFQCLFPF